jgi:hypothetical protein
LLVASSTACSSYRKRPEVIPDMEKHTAEARGGSRKEENLPTNFRKMAHFREDEASTNL